MKTTGNSSALCRFLERDHTAAYVLFSIQGNASISEQQLSLMVARVSALFRCWMLCNCVSASASQQKGLRA